MIMSFKISDLITQVFTVTGLLSFFFYYFTLAITVFTFIYYFYYLFCDITKQSADQPQANVVFYIILLTQTKMNWIYSTYNALLL